MGVYTDLQQQQTRAYINEKRRAEYKKEQKAKFTIYLYNTFIKKYENNAAYNPENVYIYFLNIDNKKRILSKNIDGVDLITKINLYDQLLNKIHKQYKMQYKMLYDLSNLEKEEKEAQKIIYKTFKEKEKAEQLQKERAAVHKKRILKNNRGVIPGRARSFKKI